MLLMAPWPWYITGPIIAFTMATLLLIGKRFGLSSNLRTMCTLAGADKVSDYFRFDWKSQSWNLIFVAGTLAGGALASFVLLDAGPVAIHPDTVAALQDMGISDAGEAFAPSLLFGEAAWSHPLSWFTLLVGGMMVGFGARWANGCTSGHAISGLSSLQWPSLIAVIGFFIGGLLVSQLLLPLLIPAL